MDLPLETQKVVDILKRKVQSTPILVFPDFDKPFLLETDASKEGLGPVLSQKQSAGHYHPVAFGSHSLTPLEKNYHSSKLEFLVLKWSIMEHFKEYLAYSPFVMQTDNNPLTYVLMIPNLATTGHRWFSALASFQFKGAGGEACTHAHCRLGRSPGGRCCLRHAASGFVSGRTCHFQNGMPFSRSAW